MSLSFQLELESFKVQLELELEAGQCRRASDRHGPGDGSTSVQRFFKFEASSFFKLFYLAHELNDDEVQRKRQGSINHGRQVEQERLFQSGFAQ